MNLLAAIQPGLPARISIVGAGGKTTALFELARQLPGPVWVTTSTHLGIDQLGLADVTHILTDDTTSDAFQHLLDRPVTLFIGGYTPDMRAKGPGKEAFEMIHDFAEKRGISLLVEADGSRSLPVKAPAEHEPVIPVWSRCVIVVAGLSALGKPFSSQWVCRPERFAEISGINEDEAITIDHLAAVFTHPSGGLKGIPPGATRVALFNQADTAKKRGLVGQIAPRLLAAGYDQVITGSLKRFPKDLVLYS